MIRQAISCDICGTEKRQTNHWFVATEKAGELRITGFGAQTRRRPGTKHLCGQTCLNKLLDEFISRTIAGTHTSRDETAQPSADSSLTTVRAPAYPTIPFRPPNEERNPPQAKTMPVALAKPVLVSPLVMPLPVHASDPMPGSLYTVRYSRAEAWERERERTQGRGDAHRPHKRF